MVAANFDQHKVRGRIVLQPNCSWSWRANAFLVGTLLVLSSCIALPFTLQGLWLVLPFSLLEIAVLTACLYCCVRRTHTTEVLTLSQTQLVFEKGIDKPTQRLAFNRCFSRFLVDPPRYPWHRKSVALICGGTKLEVGGFLTDNEKDDLVSQLRKIINHLDRSPVRAELVPVD